MTQKIEEKQIKLGEFVTLAGIHVMYKYFTSFYYIPKELPNYRLENERRERLNMKKISFGDYLWSRVLRNF